ncbi:hypothetical protein CpecG_0477 [Chlamydia pecorum MC/MarsBar]|nr:hypothetical protein CpecF_0478 [Chlamydia pecorum DBDeUG]ETF40052.1 hypothetical protein CpecG_0477 [Chlamydia pecorum MC/MarsBar]ETF40586.1 hypothetical protein CpecA_0480 [Chlamydia pecorum IPTaLE]
MKGVMHEKYSLLSLWFLKIHLQSDEIGNNNTKKKASLSLFWQEVKLVFSLKGDSLSRKCRTLPIKKF